MSRVFISLLFCLLVVSTLGATVVVATESSLEIDGALETPTETKEVDGEVYEASEIAVHDAGERLGIDVTAPGDFTVEVVNSEEELEVWEDGSGNEQIEFDTASFSLGTHSIRLYNDGQLEDVMPLVINGYDITVDSPEETPVDEPAEFSLNVTPTERDTQFGEVRVVVWNGDESETVVADQVTGNEYTATVSTETLENDEYDVYAVAVSEDEFYGEPEVLAVSDKASLKITDSDESDDSEASDGETDPSNGTNSESDTNETTDEELDGNTTDEELNETPEQNNSSTDEQPTNSTDDATVDNGSETADNTTENDSKSENDGVIAPTEPANESAKSSSSEESSDETPATGVPAVLFSVLLIGCCAQLLSRR